jgi:hypothetical protein
LFIEEKQKIWIQVHHLLFFFFFLIINIVFGIAVNSEMVMQMDTNLVLFK